MALKRITKEWRDLQKEPVDNVTAAPDGEDMFTWKAMILGCVRVCCTRAIGSPPASVPVRLPVPLRCLSAYLSACMPTCVPACSRTRVHFFCLGLACAYGHGVCTRANAPQAILEPLRGRPVSPRRSLSFRRAPPPATRAHPTSFTPPTAPRPPRFCARDDEMMRCDARVQYPFKPPKVNFTTKVHAHARVRACMGGCA